MCCKYFQLGFMLFFFFPEEVLKFTSIDIFFLNGFVCLFLCFFISFSFFLDIIFFERFLVHSRIERQVQRVSTCPRPLTHTPPPSSTSSPTWRIGTIDGPAPNVVSPQSLQLTFGFALGGVYSLSLGERATV